MQETGSSSAVTAVLRALSDDDTLVSGLGVSTDLRRALFTEMVQLRAFDEACVALQRDGTLPSFFSAATQEAVICGAAHALESTDVIFPTAREYGVALQRGVDPKLLAASLFGRADAPGKGHQAPCYVSFRSAGIASVSGIIGAHLPQAVGFAWAARTRRASKEARVVVAFFGDGATSSGEFHNALNFAGVMKAPVLFVCRNNGVALSTPVAKQTASETLAEKAHAYGIPGLEVDGTDVIAVHQAVRAWADAARNGGGAMLLEARTDPARDPVARVERHLRNDNLLSEEAIRTIREEAVARATRALSEAAAMRAPSARSLFDDVFAELTPELLRQREQAFPDQKEASNMTSEMKP